MKPILIIKAGTTFPEIQKELGDFEDWTAAGLGVSKNQVHVTAVYDNEPLPDPEMNAGIIVTGSHSMVTEPEPWAERLLQWIPGVLKKEIPFLGICYGHQLLACAMGGRVGYHPQGREIGTVDIHLLPAARPDPLMGQFPETFLAHVTHAQTVLQPPSGATVLACNDFEAHHAIRIGTAAWGIQFHPEFSAQIMSDYIDQQAEHLRDSGREVATIHSTVRETPVAGRVLSAFYRLVSESLLNTNME